MNVYLAHICKFNCIVMRYSIGYAPNSHAVQFLKRMARNLACSKKEHPRVSQREGYIIIQYQIMPEDREEIVVNE